MASLKHKEFPRWRAKDCMEGRCSESGRQRWRDHKSIWEGDDFQSGSVKERNEMRDAVKLNWSQQAAMKWKPC